MLRVQLSLAAFLFHASNSKLNVSLEGFKPLAIEARSHSG